jgi:tetratricopeptide (TPR) repeat protein
MKKESESGTFGKVLKWVGYLTAILSLCATIVGFAKYGYGKMKVRREVEDLLASEAVQLQSHDYPSAWQSLEKAVKLQPESPKVREAREALAMAWLEDIHAAGSEKFSDVTKKLEPVLTEAVATMKPGPERADLRAHLGWAYFLESRENRFDLDPAVPYAAAIAEDPNNPYAHAMWGHWILWQNCDQISEAEGHFAEAMQANRLGDYVRKMQLAALLNCHDEEAEAEAIKVANAMRLEQRKPDDWSRHHILGQYAELMYEPNGSEAKKIVSAVPAEQHVATFHWLADGFEDNGSDRLSRKYYLAMLEEAAGQKDRALEDYQSVLKELREHSGSLWFSTDAAVKRLTRAK